MVCQKLLPLYPKLQLAEGSPDLTLRNNLLELMEDLMHKQLFSRSKLETKLENFAYVLQPNHFFYYVHVLFADRTLILKELLRNKACLREAIEDRMVEKYDVLTREHLY